MSIENQIAQIFVDFVEIFGKINRNNYSDSQKNEMMELFEEQIVEKCLDFFCSSRMFVKNFTDFTDLVLDVIHKEEAINLETRECFINIFDKAVIVHEANNKVDNLNEPFIDDCEYEADQIKDIKKKNNLLKDEVDDLREEIEEKNVNMTELESLYIKLKYDYYKLNDQFETLNEDNSFLRNKCSASQLRITEKEKEDKEELLTLVENIEDLKICLADKDVSIGELEKEAKQFVVSVTSLKEEVKIKNKLLEDLKNIMEGLRNYEFDSEFDPECVEELSEVFNVVSNQNVKESSQNIVNKLLCNEKYLSETSLVGVSFAVDNYDSEFKENEINFCSSRKSLSEELLGAWNVISATEDDLEHDDLGIQYNDFFGRLVIDEKPGNFEGLNYFKDSGFNQMSVSEVAFRSDLSAELTKSSVKPSEQFNERENPSFDDEIEDKHVREDIHSKLKEIREQLSVLESNLRERRKKVNKSLSSTLLSIIYSCFELFY